MAFSDYGPPRRSRRRRNIAILIVLAVVIGVLVMAVRYRTERRESIDYLSAAEEVAATHAELAERLGTLLQGLGQEERPAVVQRLETLSTEAQQLRRDLDEMTVTRPIAEVSGRMTVAVEAWEEGISSIDDAMIAVLDGDREDRSGDEQLRSAFEVLRLGDRAYSDMLESVIRLDPEIVPAEFPEVSYTNGEFAALYDAEVIAERLRRLGGLSEVRDVAIVATTIPEPVSEGVGGIWMIPASESFSLEVTVSNTGNVTAEIVTVVVTINQASSPEEIPPIGQAIPAIEPGASATLLFEDLDIEPGQVYTITATASFEDGGDVTDDNTWSLTLERNGE
jgi:hypothetical protein